MICIDIPNVKNGAQTMAKYNMASPLTPTSARDLDFESLTLKINRANPPNHTDSKSSNGARVIGNMTKLRTKKSTVFFNNFT